MTRDFFVVDAGSVSISSACLRKQQIVGAEGPNRRDHQGSLWSRWDSEDG